MSALPAVLPPIELDEHRFDLHQRASDFLADVDFEGEGQDTAAIVRRFIDTLSPTEMRTALEAALPRYFYDVWRKGLRDAVREPDSGDGQAQVPRRSRWSKMDHAAVEALREKVFTRLVVTASGKKRFGECTPEDVRFLADERQRQSDRMADWAGRFDKICKAMKRADAATVAELGDEAVRLIADA